MTQAEIMSKLTLIFQNVFDDDTLELSRSTTAEDIEEWDSLNQIKIILAAQTAFGVKLPASQINKLKNVGEMVDLLKKSLA